MPGRSRYAVVLTEEERSEHRGRASIDRLHGRWPNLTLVHLPTHASWLNQIEIYFSIVQRKLLQPNPFESLAELAHALNEFDRAQGSNLRRRRGAAAQWRTDALMRLWQRCGPPSLSTRTSCAG
jgi:DDE superfamily endonuclease